MANYALFSAKSSEWDEQVIVDPPTSSSQRYFSKSESVSGLDITLGANERLICEFMIFHTDNFQEILSGANTGISISKGNRPDAVMLLNNGSSVDYYSISAYYSHGCFNTLELVINSDATQVEIVLNGNSCGSKSIGSNVININNLGDKLRYIRRLEHVNSSSVTLLRYDFLESSGVTASPSVGSGNLTFTSEPKRFEFILTNGVWVAEPIGFPDAVKISIPDDALQYRVAPVTNPASVHYLWGYGQSLGRNFLNGTANEPRHTSTIDNGYSFSSSDNLLTKFACRSDIASAGYIELAAAKTISSDQFVYVNTAQSATAIANLSKGSSAYDAVLGANAALNNLADYTPDLPINKFSMLFTQGEEDASTSVTTSEYKTALSQLKNDAKTDAANYSGNASIDFKFIYTQLGRPQSLRSIVQAHYEFARDNEDSEVVYAGSRWPLNKYYPDKLDSPPDFVHLSPLGYAVLAEIHGRAAVDPNFKALLPMSAISDISGSSQTVTVNCDMETPPLRKFSDVSDPTLGLYYVSPLGVESEIVSATLSNNAIIVNLGRVAEVGSKIRGGNSTGSRDSLLPTVNIIDSTVYVGTDTGINHSHFMPIFDLEITESVQPPSNSTPTLTITSSATTVDAGQVFTLTANVTDADVGDTHTYLWSTGETTQSITITAPSLANASTITRTCVANDGASDSNTASSTVNVNAQIITAFEPVLSSSTASSSICFERALNVELTDNYTLTLDSRYLSGEVIVSAFVTTESGLITINSVTNNGSVISALCTGVGVGKADLHFSWATATRSGCATYGVFIEEC